MIRTDSHMLNSSTERPLRIEAPSPSDSMLTSSRSSVRSGPTRLMRIESIRGFAAAYVVLHHLQIACAGRPALLLSFGQEAVILFFILSGFVIHHATCVVRQREPFRAYFFRRFRGIYPMFLFALLYSYAVSCLGERSLLQFQAGEFVGNLTMLQDLQWVKRGTRVGPFCGNSPLWSLSYEWWFYMMFYPLVYAIRMRPAYHKYLVIALSIINVCLYQIVPNQGSLFLAYFPIWWAGVEFSREFEHSGKLTWRVQAPMLSGLVILSALWFVPTYFLWQCDALRSYGFEPLLQFRHSLAGLAFVVVGIVWYKLGFIGFGQTLGPFRILAPISYAIYILHTPPLTQISLRIPRGEGRVVAAVVTLSLVLGLAFLLEARLQVKINRWTDIWRRRQRYSIARTE